MAAAILRSIADPYSEGQTYEIGGKCLVSIALDKLFALNLDFYLELLCGDCTLSNFLY